MAASLLQSSPRQTKISLGAILSDWGPWSPAALGAPVFLLSISTWGCGPETQNDLKEVQSWDVKATGIRKVT